MNAGLPSTMFNAVKAILILLTNNAQKLGLKCEKVHKITYKLLI